MARTSAITGMMYLTFQELRAKKITLGLFFVCTLAWLVLSFALNLDVVEGTIAGIRIFGLDASPTHRDPDTGELVRQAVSLDSFVLGVQQFVGGAAYLLGTLLGLFATAPLIAGLLERGRIDLLLSKPAGRSRLLAGHVLGVWTAALVVAAYLIGAVWLVMSLKTGVWNPAFLWSAGIIAAMFAVMYGVVLLIGVTTQSTALALIVSYGLIFISAIFAAHEQLVPQLTPPWRQVFLGLYHTLPNFIEVTAVMAKLAGREAVASWYPFGSSLLFGLFAYATAFLWFERRDF